MRWPSGRKWPCLILTLLGLVMAGRNGAAATSFPYGSAKTCGACHEDIYRMWSRSLHAMSLSDPIFDAAYLQVLRATDGKAQETCLRCHAPTTRVTRDFSLKNPISREGVTCDFCHTVTAVNMKHPTEPYTMVPGKTKAGPFRDVVSPGHQTFYSPVHETSELCGGCHQYVAPNGTPIMSTYSEWKLSAYAMNRVQCQDCHMPAVKEATTVKPGVKVSAKRVNTHDLQGSHSVEQLRHAAKVEILELDQKSDAILVVVRVTNAGSGHMIPTGTPSRKLLLTARLKGPRKEILRESTIRYQKILVDDQLNPVENDVDVFVKPVKVLTDTRLRPQEARVERFVFPVTPELLSEERILHRTYPRTYEVEVELTYRYTPVVLQPADMTVEMARDSRALP